MFNKVFFFEKKKQKTFGHLGPLFPHARPQFAKVFWFFFSKKNALPSFDETLALGTARMTEEELQALLTGDPAIAARHVGALARQGVLAAQVRYGRMLLDGVGVERDFERASGWFRTAARDGDADAMNMAGRCYENGWGVARDDGVAAHWFARSASLGHAWGQYNFGHMFLDGRGVEKDLGAAFGWYMKAALQGHARAMNLVGRCLEEGWGTGRDMAAAEGWYRRSAQAGYFRAQYNLASVVVGQRLAG